MQMKDSSDAVISRKTFPKVKRNLAEDSSDDASAKMPAKRVKKHNRTASGSRSIHNRGSKSTRLKRFYDSREDKLQIQESSGHG